jgi:hypothetical protein
MVENGLGRLYPGASGTAKDGIRRHARVKAQCRLILPDKSMKVNLESTRNRRNAVCGKEPTRAESSLRSAGSFSAVEAQRSGRMVMKGIRWIATAGLLSFCGLLANQGAAAQGLFVVHFSGLLNDYSPSTVSGGPWEMHGQWTMDLNERTGTADFSADMTMSGYGTNATGAPDATQGGVKAHTHHIRLTNVKITWNNETCPTYSPATFGGFQITGTVSLLTGNGSNATFETQPPSSVLQVCVTGGENANSVPYSNITLQFQTGSPAIQHFGSQPIHGVVRKADSEWAFPRAGALLFDPTKDGAR